MMVACLVIMFAQYSVAQERVISAGSAVTELIYALEAQDELVAVDVTSTLPEGTVLPKIGYHRQLSVEGLMDLKPTRIIGSDEMGPLSTLTLLQQADIKVNVINTEPTVDGLLLRIDQLAAITHKQTQAVEVKTIVNAQVAALKRNQPASSDKKKILFLLIHEGRPANVAGGETTPNEIISLAGGINPAEASINSYKPLAMESMITMQPDVILVSGRSWKTLGGADAVLKALPMLLATPAGQSKSIVAIDGTALVGGLGLRSLAEAKRLNRILYPSL
ncbi:heme/hemin ABC transporter substrate-binding protein [Aliivibrio kagoshimensis]|uniref:heme/hemin ABC transporter substrate-binding protein n=1 Tax=Aliivibrio kagoshimensis TaxID=2910230 RepID=UPI003D0CDC47